MSLAVFSTGQHVVTVRNGARPLPTRIGLLCNLATNLAHPAFYSEGMNKESMPTSITPVGGRKNNNQGTDKAVVKWLDCFSESLRSTVHPNAWFQSAALHGIEGLSRRMKPRALKSSQPDKLNKYSILPVGHPAPLSGSSQASC